MSCRDLLPDLLVVDLPLVTPLPWLEDPDRLDRLVRGLLAGEPAGNDQE